MGFVLKFLPLIHLTNYACTGVREDLSIYDDLKTYVQTHHDVPQEIVELLSSVPTADTPRLGTDTAQLPTHYT